MKKKETAKGDVGYLDLKYNVWNYQVLKIKVLGVSTHTKHANSKYVWFHVLAGDIGPIGVAVESVSTQFPNHDFTDVDFSNIQPGSIVSFDFKNEVDKYFYVVDDADDQVKKTIVHTGCKCRHCGDFNPYAEPNMTDGLFLCFSCKVTDAWRYR